MKKEIQNNKKRQLNSGFTLVEVIVGIAILGILSMIVANVYTSSFDFVFSGGREVKEEYLALSELDLAMRDPAYNGQNHSDNVTQETVSVTIFGETVETTLIKSKLRDQNSALDDSIDSYVMTYVVRDSDVYHDGEAFIAVNRKNDLNYKAGDIPVTAEMLNGNYMYNGSGMLVIPSSSALVLAGMDYVNWKVKDGIYIDENVEIVSLDYIKLKSQNEDIIANKVIMTATNEIDIEAHTDLMLKSVDMTSENGDIYLRGTLINVEGSDTIPTSLEIDRMGEIKYYASSVNGEIFLNQYLFMTINHTSNQYGQNVNNATLTSPNSTSSPNLFR